MINVTNKYRTFWRSNIKMSGVEVVSFYMQQGVKTPHIVKTQWADLHRG